MTIKLKGHETFAIREGWLNKGMIAVENSKKAFVQSFGADVLGVGTNMAKAIRYWLKAGGFTDDRGKGCVKLSSIGEIILKNDRYLEDLFSYWIFHINLLWNKEQATSWYLIFNEISMEEFTKEELTFALGKELEKMGEENYSERSLGDDVTVFMNMYTREKTEEYDPEEKKISPFSKLGLVKRSEKKYRMESPDYNYLHELVVLYALEKYFRQKDTDEATIDELINAPLSPGKVLNLKRVKMNAYLDRLEECGYITVNRTAGLDMVYRKQKKTLEEIVENYYA